MELRKMCPKFNRAIYKYGEDILEDKIKKSTGTEKVAFIKDLQKLWEERAVNFAKKTKKGEYMAKDCQLQYDNKTELGLSDADLYACFDNAFTTDRKNFKNAKSLYIYFKLMVALYDKGEKSDQELFDKYDDISEKIEEEVAYHSEKFNKLVAKEDAGTALTSKEKRFKKYHSQSLTAYGKIAPSLDAELGPRANCTNLVPLYQKDFDANRSNADWLKRAVSKMYHKDCTSDPLYEKLVKAYDETAPSSDTKYFVSTILFQ